MIATEAIPADQPTSRKSSEKVDTQLQDQLYEEASGSFAPALERLARAYEADPDHRRDLLQEIHIALWRSLGTFDRRCSLRTWVYRVAHNVGATHVLRRQRMKVLVSLEDLENIPAASGQKNELHRGQVLDRLLTLIQRLKPLDRHVILSYLEGLDAASIGETTGLSASNVATKIHRIKSVLTQLFHEGRA